MKDNFFTYLLRFNLLIVAVVFILGLVFLWHYYGGLQFGGDAITVAFAISVYSNPLWLGLFVMGIMLRKQL